ncbi:MAG: hypothetical protein ACYTGX_06680 [Planctomycetota bacterium]
MPSYHGIRIKGDRPTWREKRDILADPNASPKGLVELGKTIEQVGQLEEAISYYGAAKAHDEIQRLRAVGVETGDWFLWSFACKAMDELNPPEAEGRALAAKALEQGQLFNARNALLAIGDDAGAAEVESQIPTALPLKPVEVEMAEAVEEFEAAEQAEERAAAGDSASGGPDDEGSEGQQGRAVVG